jgi:ssDNA-binding Zn-finger/Zn-ribbon topoisomerase 1
MTIENLTCPECEGPMTSRKNATTGQRFWGCNSFPKCRGTRNTDGEAPRERPSERDDRSPSERQRDNDRSRWRHQ